MAGHLFTSLYWDQWEMSLQSNMISHWLGTNLKSALRVCLSRPQWLKKHKNKLNREMRKFHFAGSCLWQSIQGPFPCLEFHRLFRFKWNTILPDFNRSQMITTKFCTCRNSCAVKASVEFWNDTIVSWNTIHCWFITLNFEWKKCPWNSFLGWVVKEPPGSAFIKPDQRNPWIKDQIKITLLPTISHLLLPNFVSCGRACPSHMTQNLVTVGAKLWTADRFIVDPWSMDYADPVW